MAKDQARVDTGRRWSDLVAFARRIPLGWHAVALGVVLLGALPLLDTGAIGMADEGAVLVQAQIVRETGEWGITAPTEAIDPEGRWFPVPLSEELDGRWYPYTKHTVYPQILAVTFDLGGYRGVLALHVLGVVATALAGACIARRAAPDHVRLTLWTLGLASPLFFDGYWAVAHAFGCAGAALAVVGVLRASEGRRLGGIALLVGGLAFAVLMRSEAAIFGLALAVAIVAVGWRDRRRDALALGAVTLVTTACGYLGSAELERIAMGGSALTPFTVVDQRQGFVEGRFTGLWHSLLSPQLGGSSDGWLLCALGAVGCLVAWWFARRRPDEGGIIVAGAVIAWLAWTMRLLLPVRPVAGLLVAAPVVLAGLLSWKRSLRTRTRDLLAVTVGLYALGVLATQYGTGGTGDWGGRYFRLAVPLLIPLGLVAISDTLRGVSARVRPVLVGSLVGSCVAITLLGGMTLRRMHVNTHDRVEATAALAADTSSALQEGGPVVVSTRGEFGRFAWEHVLDGRYLGVPEEEDLPEVARSLVANGVDEFVFAGPADEVESGLELVTPDGYTVTKRASVSGADWQMAVVTRGV